jgi:small subunit ribosomal protein S4
MYGIMERQFRKYFQLAAAHRGSTGETLLKQLETRLDNVAYRLGYFPTRAMARQQVSHGHVQVNGNIVNVPSFQVRVGQTISLTQAAADLELVKTRLQNSAIIPPAWLKREGPVGQIVSAPSRSDIDSSINEQLIVEYYSR